MEGIPTFEKVIQGADWRERKAEAPKQAEDLIAGIEGFVDMSAVEKKAALGALIDQLADEGNENRFVAREIARQQAILEEEERHQKRMDVLQRTN